MYTGNKLALIFGIFATVAFLLSDQVDAKLLDKEDTELQVRELLQYLTDGRKYVDTSLSFCFADVPMDHAPLLLTTSLNILMTLLVLTI